MRTSLAPRLPDSPRWPLALVLVVAAAALFGAYLIGPQPSESSDGPADDAARTRDGQPSPPPATNPANATRPAEDAEAWAVFARTLGASGLLNVSLVSLEDGVAVVALTEIDAAGGESAWRERIRVATREVISTTNPRGAHAVPGYDAAPGDATWIYVPNGSQAGDRVRILATTYTLEPGPHGTLLACGPLLDFEGLSACYQYEPASGAYVGWISNDQPGWSLVEASPAVEARLSPARE